MNLLTRVLKKVSDPLNEYKYKKRQEIILTMVKKETLCLTALVSCPII